MEYQLILLLGGPSHGEVVEYAGRNREPIKINKPLKWDEDPLTTMSTIFYRIERFIFGNKQITFGLYEKLTDRQEIDALFFSTFIKEAYQSMFRRR